MMLKELGDAEIDGLSPTDKEVDDYLAEPDDKVAAHLRETLDAETFRFIGKQILFSKKIARAQAQETLRQIVELIEKDIFYVDVSGYIALRPNASTNFKDLKSQIKGRC